MGKLNHHLKIRTRGDKKEYLFRYQADGVERTKKIPAATIGEARRIRDQWLESWKQHAETPKPMGITLNDAVDLFFRVKTDLSPATVQGRKILLKMVVDHFGSDTNLVDITPGKIVRWIDTLKSGRKSGTARQHYFALRSVFKVAQQRDFISQNPFDRITLADHLPKDQSTRVGFTRNEIELLLEQSRHNPILEGFIILAAATGGRKTEVLQIRWQDIGPSSVMFVHDPSQKMFTKSRKSRAVPVSPAILARIRALLPPQNEWVFPSPVNDGHFTAIHQPFSRACSRAGIEGKSIHCLRHSALTFMTQTVGVVGARDLAGHHSVEITNTYLHSDQTDHQKIAGEMENFLTFEDKPGPKPGPDHIEGVPEGVSDKVVSLMDKVG